MAGSVGSHSSHLWVTDTRGGVFLCQDINALIDSTHSAVPPGTASPPAVGPSWRRVEGRLEKVAGGFSGLVCGTRGPVLYVRKGVTHDNPEGTSWTKAFCDATDFSVGSQCLVRRTSQGELFATAIDHSTLPAPVFLPSWSALPECHFMELQGCRHFILDAQDNIYLLSPAGEVYGCSGVASSSSEAAGWRLVAKPPLRRSSGYSLFSFFSWGKQADFFSLACSGSQVAPGSRSLWCIGRDGGEVWQLVLSDVASEEGNTELKINWIKFDLPKEDNPLVVLCADKTRTDSLYAIADEGRALVGYSLLQENAGRLALSAPGEEESALWQSIAVCQTQATRLSQMPHVQRQHTSSLYPKLPVSDLCCEEGDCEFCRAAAMSQRVGPSGAEMPPGPGWQVSGCVGKRKRVEEGYDEEQYYTSVSSPKRPHLLNPRLALLEGVDIGVNNTLLLPRIQQAFVRQHEIFLPLTPEQVEARFSYSFDIELKVLQEASRELGCTIPPAPPRSS